MTYEDAVFRARLAYDQGFTKQAAESTGDPEKDAVANEIHAAHQIGAMRSNTNKVLDNAEAAIRAQGDKRMQGQREQEFINWDKNYKDPQGKANMDLKEQNAILEKQLADNAAAANRNWSIGAGIGGGLAVGGAAYGLAGLFPSLRKRRLLRALIALGAGGAGGVGIGYGVSKGLESGKLQAALGSAKDKAVGAYNTVANKANNVVSAIKG